MPTLTDLGFTIFNRKPSVLDEQIDNPSQVFTDLGIPGEKLSEVNFNKVITGILRVDEYLQSKDYVQYTSGWKIWDDDGVGKMEANVIYAGAYIKVFSQDAIPTSEHIGDLWVDTDDNNQLYRAAIRGADQITSGEWESVRDTAYTAKIVTFIQASAPTALATGDLWVDSDDGDRLYRWSGSAWVDIQDTDIPAAQADATTAIANAATAQAEADRKVVTFIQTTAPTAEQDGDLWFDSDDENKVYRWSGAAWVSAQDLVANWSLVVDDDTNKPDDNADVTGDNTSANTTAVNVRLSTDFVGFGNGIDGNVTISANTTLTADMYYDTLTINNGYVLSPNGYRIFCKTALINNGTIRFNGNNGTNGQSPDGGGAGAAGGALVADGTIRGSRAGSDAGMAGGTAPAGGAENPSIGSHGSAGGTSGTSAFGSQKAGGVAGAATAEKLLYDLLIKSEELTAGTEDEINLVPVYEIPIATGRTSDSTLSTSAGSGGGGTAADTSSGGGGGAGATGGCIFIAAKTLTNSGTIEANGGNGGDGGDGDAGEHGGGGGGAGGSGGVIILFYETITVGTITATGGSGGSGGSGGAGSSGRDGSNGTNGVAGKIYRLKKA